MYLEINYISICQITDLDQSHRTEKQDPENKRKPVIMKFIQYNDCKKIFIN